mmetsp:Transcript_22669/g.21846  ORF Transcript_22669/g.21846 Transcript_22669/m.21846 type:complete len:90 (-) Transcript_22669:537-806(-)
MIPGGLKKNLQIPEEMDLSEEGSSSESNPLMQLRLVRNQSRGNGFSNSGYLFLAIVFCMMCCSSLFYTSTASLKQTFDQVLATSQIKNG